MADSKRLDEPTVQITDWLWSLSYFRSTGKAVSFRTQELHRHRDDDTRAHLANYFGDPT